MFIIKFNILIMLEIDDLAHVLFSIFLVIHDFNKIYILLCAFQYNFLYFFKY